MRRKREEGGMKVGERRPFNFPFFFFLFFNAANIFCAFSLKLLLLVKKGETEQKYKSFELKDIKLQCYVDGTDYKQQSPFHLPWDSDKKLKFRLIGRDKLRKKENTGYVALYFEDIIRVYLNTHLNFLPQHINHYTHLNFLPQHTNH